MARQCPWLTEIRTALTARPVAISSDPSDCALLLERMAARRHREARGALDPVTAAAIEADAERLEKLLELVRRELPARRRALPLAHSGGAAT